MVKFVNKNNESRHFLYFFFNGSSDQTKYVGFMLY